MMINYDKPVEYGMPVDLEGTFLSDKPKRIKTYQTAELHDAPMMQPWLWTFQSATESPQMHIAMEWRTAKNPTSFGCSLGDLKGWNLRHRSHQKISQCLWPAPS